MIDCEYYSNYYMIDCEYYSNYYGPELIKCTLSEEDVTNLVT